MTTTAIAGDGVLGDLPSGLRDPLLAAFGEIVRNFREARWEPAELNGGKLCEVVYTILRGYIDNSYPSAPAKPPNMVDACRGLEEAPASLPRSVRIQIPRMLLALYEIRNNRGVGHVGGDVDPNHMDAVVVLYMAKWIMAELIRIFHTVDTETATAAVEALIEREVPLVWEVAGVKRVLNPSLSRKDKALLLLHATSGPVPEADLARWIEHPVLSHFRRDVLTPAHRAKLLERDAATGLVHLSPNGARYVEERLLPAVS